MLQSAFDTPRFYGSIILNLCFSLLFIGLVYFVHILIQRRREYEVNLAKMTYVETTN